MTPACRKHLVQTTIAAVLALSAAVTALAQLGPPSVDSGLPSGVSAPPAAAAPAAPAPTPVASAAAPAAAPATQTAPGSLDYAQRQYFPQGCTHNGSTAVCTFAFVNQGNLATLNANLELRELQFIDDGHVPHASNRHYFVDPYGAHQVVLVVQHGDRGTLMAEFPNVDARVSGGAFHLGTQMIAGVTLTQPPVPASQGATVLAAAPATTPGAAAQAAAPQANCTGQNATTVGCKTAQKLNAAETSASNQVGSLAAPAKALQQMGSAIGSLFGKKPAAAQPADATQTPAPQASSQ